jgi:hypothetical protein
MMAPRVDQITVDDLAVVVAAFGQAGLPGVGRQA